MTELAGTGALLRLILRRDRFILPIWLAVVAGLAWASGVSFAQLYPTPEARAAYVAQVASNPAVVALLGPVFAPSVGGLIAWRWTIQGVFFAGLASLLTVVRHTRADEEAGRRELLGSTVVGRQATLMAALLVVFAANLLVATLVAGGLVGLGLPASGSIALGLSVAGVGCTVAAGTAVIAQLTESAGAARALAGATFGLTVLLRMVGDVSGATGGSDWLSWLSPVGWARFSRPFAGEQWWVYGLFLAAVVGLASLAYVLSACRDLGAGILRERPGPPVAGSALSGPFGPKKSWYMSTTSAWDVCVAGGSIEAATQSRSTPKGEQLVAH